MTTPQEPSSPIQTIADLCLDALTTDGAHHKQWYLEKILQEVHEPYTFNKLRDEVGWDEGIAP
jgi:hypothetical protein